MVSGDILWLRRVILTVSRIYKDKYMPPPIPADDEGRSRGLEKDKEKKPRDKSRTRTIFGGRKKSAV